MARSHDQRTAKWTALVVLGLLFALGRPAPASSGDEARRFLATTLAVGADDIARLDAGEVVTRTLTAPDPREVATVGIVRIRMTPDFYVSRLVDIVNFKRADAVLQIGVFGSPPTAADVAALTLDESDLHN